MIFVRHKHSMKIISEGRGLVVGFEPFDISDYPKLEVIGCPATSCEHLPWDEIKKRGIKVISLASPRDKETEEFLSTISSTAEHTIGLIIALLRNYKAALNGPYKDREAYRGHTLRGKTVLVFGRGRIGKQIINMAWPLGMETLSFDTDDWDGTDIFLWNMLEDADIVSVHIPLSGNEGFFTKEMFQQMRPESYFINTSRSGVVDKGALLWALEHGIIAGAAVDFIDDPDLVRYEKTHDNLILTNHLGGCTFEDMQRTEDFIVRKIEEFLHN